MTISCSIGSCLVPGRRAIAGGGSLSVISQTPLQAPTLSANCGACPSCCGSLQSCCVVANCKDLCMGNEVPSPPHSPYTPHTPCRLPCTTLHHHSHPLPPEQGSIIAADLHEALPTLPCACRTGQSCNLCYIVAYTIAQLGHSTGGCSWCIIISGISSCE